MSKRTNLGLLLFGSFLILCVAASAVINWAVDVLPPAKSYYSGTIERMVNSAVLVQTEDGSGSGTLIAKGGECFVLTAGHVVEGFNDGIVVAIPLLHGGVIVDRSEYKTDLLAYSDAEIGDDIAVLRVKWGGLGARAAPFRLADTPPVGATLLHVGSFLGPDGINSFSQGFVSFIGREYNGFVLDQMTAPAYPGSSGGGVYTVDGRYAGMLVRGADSTYTLFVPARRLQQWAVANAFDWLFDPSGKVPANLKPIAPFAPASRPEDEYPMLP